MYTTQAESTTTANQLGLSTIIGAVGCGINDTLIVHAQVKSLTANSFTQITRYWSGSSWDASGATVRWIVWGTL